MKSFHVEVDVYDPWADKAEVRDEYGIDILTHEEEIAGGYDAIILAVAHKEFTEMDFERIKAPQSVVYDVKAILPKEVVDGRL